jgi:hypothetical protein
MRIELPDGMIHERPKAKAGGALGAAADPSATNCAISCKTHCKTHCKAALAPVQSVQFKAL